VFTAELVTDKGRTTIAKDESLPSLCITLSELPVLVESEIYGELTAMASTLEISYEQ